MLVFYNLLPDDGASRPEIRRAFFFDHGATSPSGSRPPHYPAFTITLIHTTLGVGLFWTSDQFVADTST